MSFGGDYGKDPGDYVNMAKDAAASLPAITIKDEENEFDSKEFKGEYEKISRDVVEYTTPIITALNGLPVYYRFHIKNGSELALGKGLKIVRCQDFTKRRNQSQKRKEKTRKETKDKGGGCRG